MSSNEQRRQAAKRKLERRLERQQQAARKRKIIIISTSVVLVVAVAAVATTLIVKKVADDNEKERWTACSFTEDKSNPLDSLPPIDQIPPERHAEYQKYKDELIAAQSKERTTAMPGGKQLKKGGFSATFETSQGAIPIDFSRQEAPCNSGAFETMIKAHFFDSTTCHRLTTEGIKVLQCGDPTATGAGGPGWKSPDEKPANLAPAGQPDPSSGVQPVTYPRGTVAVANTGQENTGSSQFFLVIQDSQLAPNYSVVGKVTPEGLKVLDKVLTAGVAPGQTSATDGKPALPVDISTASIDN